MSACVVFLKQPVSHRLASCKPMKRATSPEPLEPASRMAALSVCVANLSQCEEYGAMYSCIQGVQCYDTLSSRAAGALLSTVRVTDGSLLLNRLLFTPLEEARAEAKGNEPMFLTSSYCYTRMFLLPLVVLCPVNQSVSLLGYLQIGVKQVIKKHCSSKGNFHPPVQ